MNLKAIFTSKKDSVISEFKLHLEILIKKLCRKDELKIISGSVILHEMR